MKAVLVMLIVPIAWLYIARLMFPQYRRLVIAHWPLASEVTLTWWYSAFVLLSWIIFLSVMVRP